MDTVRDISEFPGTGLLLALDVDGVLNAFPAAGKSTSSSLMPTPHGFEQRRVRMGHGAKYIIDFNPLIIAELDRLIRAHGIELGWLTTWGPNVVALIEQALDGKLSGGYILAKRPKSSHGWIPANWKYYGLRDRLAVTGQPWAWFDDDAIDMSLASELLSRRSGIDTIAGVDGLLVPTNDATGITWSDLAELDRHARASTALEAPPRT
jgi:hypothetical protein